MAFVLAGLPVPAGLFVLAGSAAGLVSGVVRAETNAATIAVQTAGAGLLIGGLHALAVRTWSRRRVGLLLLLTLCAVPATAQEDPHAACAAPPAYVPAELLDRPVPLRRDTGNSHEKVTTTSAEAQSFFDQGLNYLESYVWIEASRSFRQALRLDPRLAMAHLGLSYVYSGLDNPEGARQHFEKAKALASGAGDRERRRIAIREKQLAAFQDLEDAARFFAYKKAIDDALAFDLEDPALWLLRGTAEEPNATGRGQRGGAASIAFYEQVLRLAPDHASAHHYLIHTYETIGRIDKALQHGEAYARLAPAIPHAAHMWAHDLRRVGRIDEAIVQFKKADALERAYYAAEKIDPAFDWHHGHNLDLLAGCYEHKGQMRLAESTMREAAALAPVDAYRAFNMRELPNFLIHRARYAEALEAARAVARLEYPQARAVGQALAGQSLIGLGRTDDAKEALAAARRHLEEVPAVTGGLVPRRSMVQPWVDALEGELLLRSGRKEDGRALLKNVQRDMRALPGPDNWSQTLFRLESMARGAIEAGDWDLAEHTANQMLEHDAAYGGSHFTMALVLTRKGDAKGAAREMDAARRFWRDADADLPEMARLNTEASRRR
jgi:Tfp pilus assembly protein PilF